MLGVADWGRVSTELWTRLLIVFSNFIRVCIVVEGRVHAAVVVSTGKKDHCFPN